jgi:hypothetical protein
MSFRRVGWVAENVAVTPKSAESAMQSIGGRTQRNLEATSGGNGAAILGVA